MAEPISSAEIRRLKAAAQRLEPVVRIGKNGITEGTLKGLDQALSDHELVKVKFSDLKDQKKVLAPQLADQTQSTLVTLIGNVAVLYRKKPAASGAE